MDLILALRIASGESGIAESHTFRLKEVQHLEQAVEFLTKHIGPLLLPQTSLVNVREKRRHEKERREREDMPE